MLICLQYLKNKNQSQNSTKWIFLLWKVFQLFNESSISVLIIGYIFAELNNAVRTEII